MFTKYVMATKAAELIGLKPKTLANWRSQNKGPKFVKRNGTIFYSLLELNRFMAEGTK